MASYIANFATVLVVKPTAVQKIQGLESFTQLGLPACTKSGTAVTLLSAAYPDLQFTPASDAPSTLANVLDGTCAGGILHTPDLSYFMFSTDLNGTYCPLMTVGDPTFLTLNVRRPVGPAPALVPAPR